MQVLFPKKEIKILKRLAKPIKIIIIEFIIGVSSNGRTRDFGSLYHGSNPCAPTKNSTGFYAGLIFGRARIRQSEAHGEYADEQTRPRKNGYF